MKSHLWLANNKCPVKPVTHAIVFLSSPHLFTSRPLSCLYPPSLHRSAQQRSSQTNKSQSSAGNQVSICQVLSVTQTAAHDVEAAPHTVTAAGWLPQRKKTREMLKWKRLHPKRCFHFRRNLFFALHIFFFLCDRRSKLCAFCPSDFNKFVLKSSYACSISCGHQLFCTMFLFVLADRIFF